MTVRSRLIHALKGREVGQIYQNASPSFTDLLPGGYHEEVRAALWQVFFATGQVALERAPIKDIPPGIYVGPNPRPNCELTVFVIEDRRADATLANRYNCSFHFKCRSRASAGGLCQQHTNKILCFLTTCN